MEMRAGHLKVLPYMAKDQQFHIPQSDRRMLPLLSVSTGGEWRSLGQNREIPHAVYRLRARIADWHRRAHLRKALEGM